MNMHKFVIGFLFGLGIGLLTTVFTTPVRAETAQCRRIHDPVNVGPDYGATRRRLRDSEERRLNKEYEGDLARERELDRQREERNERELDNELKYYGINRDGTIDWERMQQRREELRRNLK